MAQKTIETALSPKWILRLTCLPWAWFVCLSDFLLPVRNGLLFVVLPMIALPCWACWVGREARLGRQVVGAMVLSCALSVLLTWLTPLDWGYYFKPLTPVQASGLFAASVAIPAALLWRFAEAPESAD